MRLETTIIVVGRLLIKIQRVGIIISYRKLAQNMLYKYNIPIWVLFININISLMLCTMHVAAMRVEYEL